MWWKVEELIMKAIEQFGDVGVEGNRIFGDEDFR